MTDRSCFHAGLVRAAGGPLQKLRYPASLFYNKYGAVRLLDQGVAHASHDRSTQCAEAARANDNDIRLRLTGYFQYAIIDTRIHDYTTRDGHVWRCDETTDQLHRVIHNLLSMRLFISTQLVGK